MGFSVDTATLAGLPRQLDRLRDDAAASRSYLAGHSDLGPGEGLFNHVLGGHRKAVGAVDTFFRHLDTAVSGQSVNVQVAVNHYRKTDLKAAAGLDAVLPPAPGAPWLRPDATAGAAFNDRVEPQDLLTAPRDYAGDYSFEVHFKEYLSPTSYGRWVIWEVTSLATKLGICDRPIDVFVEWLKPWLGDWAGFRACADVHQQLGSAVAAMARNVQSGAVDTQAAWGGNAADGCRRDLNRTHLGLRGADEKLQKLAAEYRSVAESTLKLVKSVAGLLVVAIDLAVAALLELTLAVATSETVVGAVAFGAAAAHKLWKIIETGSKILDCYKAAKYGADLFASACAGFSVISAGEGLPSIPAAQSRTPDTSSRKPI